MKISSFFFLGASLLSFSAVACDWGGIPEIRGTRSHDQTVAMCQMTPACLEKYEANEQCKKDWYEQRRRGFDSPSKKRAPIGEYEEFKKKIKEVKVLGKVEA